MCDPQRRRSHCRRDLRRLAPALRATPPAAPPARPDEEPEGFDYVIQPGDSLSKIAAHNDLQSWQTIYYHDRNEGFRADCPDPNLSDPGGTVFVAAGGS